ncbi:metal ABC transporter permease [Candidatus Hydrogenedentota bacterium]
MESLEQLWTFFSNAILCGVLIAVTCSFLGLLVIWKRVVFVGITLAEVSAAGIAFAFLCGFSPFIGAALFTLAVVTVLAFPFESRLVPRDAMLGVLFVLAAALSILIVSYSQLGMDEVKEVLYGNLLVAGSGDLVANVSVLIPVLILSCLFFRNILYTSVDRDMSRIMGLKVNLWELMFFYALGLAISVASKSAGSILVFTYLVVPGTTGMVLAKRMGGIFMVTATSAVLATVGGIYASFMWDMPTSQLIIVFTVGLLALAWGFRLVRPHA